MNFISDPYGNLIIGGSGSGKTNVLLNFNNQILTKFIYMPKIHSIHSTNGREKVGIKE